MILVFLIILGIVGFALVMYGDEECEDTPLWLGVFMIILAIILFIYGMFHGFINHPPTEGTHQGVLTAVDLEGIWFRHYDVYLKSSGYTEQSDETTYCIYDYEKELAEELENALGKKVKLHYSHKGGYIGWKSCGTYHIDSVEVLEE